MAAQIVAGSVVVNMLADNRQFNAALNRTSVTVNNFGNRMQGVFDRISSTLINFAAARTAFAGIPSAFSQVFSVFSGFEAQLSKVQAVSGATAKQMGELREQAKMLGRTTFFTASQVGNAQQMLAQAGFNPEQIKAALGDVLNLALAGDLDIGEAADIATNISTPFGIAADKLNRVNDVLAKAANSSNTNVREMGQAFKYAAPAAAAAGQSIEECGAAMSILANNGIKADMAGTSMRMMLIKLADSGIQKKLKEGFNVDVTGTDGKMRELMDILRDFKAATAGLGQTGQMSAFFDVFEQRAGTAALVLGSSGEAADEFREKMYNAFGTTEKMAATMADNLKGDWIAFMSAVEGMQIAFGAAFNDSSRSILQMLTSATRAAADFIAKNSKLVKDIVVLAASAAGLYVAVRAYFALSSAAAFIAPLLLRNTAAATANTATVVTAATAQRGFAFATDTATAATTRLTVAQRACAAGTQALALAGRVNPFVWVAGAAIALYSLVHWLEIAKIKQAELSNIASNNREENDKRRSTDELKMQRLKQLAGKQKLSNIEMQEAQKLYPNGQWKGFVGHFF